MHLFSLPSRAVPSWVCGSILELPGTEYAHLSLHADDKLGHCLWCGIPRTNSYWGKYCNIPPLPPRYCSVSIPIECNYFVGPCPLFIIVLQYDHPRASCSRQFAYKKLLFLCNGSTTYLDLTSQYYVIASCEGKDVMYVHLSTLGHKLSIS